MQVNLQIRHFIIKKNFQQLFLTPLLINNSKNRLDILIIIYL